MKKIFDAATEHGQWAYSSTTQSDMKLHERKKISVLLGDFYFYLGAWKVIVLRELVLNTEIRAM